MLRTCSLRNNLSDSNVLYSNVLYSNVLYSNVLYTVNTSPTFCVESSRYAPQTRSDNIFSIKMDFLEKLLQEHHWLQFAIAVATTPGPEVGMECQNAGFSALDSTIF